VKIVGALVVTLILAGCASPAATEAPASSSPDPAAMVEAAVGWARAAGFPIADATPTIDDQASFDWLANQRVSLGLEGPASGALHVFFDDAGIMRAIEDESTGRSPGRALSKSDVLDKAAGWLHSFGVDPETGTLHVASGSVGGQWDLTLDRMIDGYPVGNAPMAWWLTGDKAYVELRADGSLATLYALRPDHLPTPTVLDQATLNTQLAAVSGLSKQKLATLDPELVWLRGPDPATGKDRDVLSLNYCATERRELSWQAWCVDAGTGERSSVGGAAD